MTISNNSSLYDEWKNDHPPLFINGTSPSTFITWEFDSITSLLIAPLSKHLIFKGTLQSESSVSPSIRYFFCETLKLLPSFSIFTIG